MKALRKPLSLFMALLMCLGVFVGTGTTAFAAGETMTTYMIDLPRASDPNKAGWGHPALNFLGGWSTGENDSFSVHTQDAFNGRAIYCIEPGVGVNTGDQYTGRGEDFWDNYPSNLNPTIPPDTIKEYIGRIMTYGWQGNASTSWMSGNPEDASKIAGYIATQLLVWETVVGERDSQFNHVDANAQGKNNVTEYISADHPLYSEIFSQYSAIESAVKRHTMLPSFFSSTADAGAYELKWDGQQYSLTLTDTNGVLGDYTFSSSTTGLNFSVDGNQLTITSAQAIKGSVTIKAEKVTAQRSGVVVWTDGVTGGGKQDFATYGETVSDQMVGYLNLEVKTGNMKLIKTSEDGQVAGINFTITGEGYSATKTTNEAGEIDISDLNPGVYTVTEQSIDKYEPQETQRVTIVSGQTATVNFNNKLKRGSLEVTKTSEDGLVEGMTFHLYGTSLSGQPVDEYAVTDSSGVARFENVLIGTGYVRQYAAQQKEIKKTEEFIRKNIAGRKAKMARGRQKQLDRMDKMEALDQKEIIPHFHFPVLPLTDTEHLFVKHLAVGYHYPVLSNIEFSIKGGQKVVITGFNGIGKSTLLKTLIGEIPSMQGHFKFSDQVTIGYFEQDLEWQEPELTPIQIVANAYPDMVTKDVRKHLARCGISSKHAMQAIGTLSGGEQAKVKMCLLTLTPCNFLIMDEPTNHLDVQAKEALKTALSTFAGTVLLVSHEEAFYRDWTQRIINIEKK